MHQQQLLIGKGNSDEKTE